MVDQLRKSFGGLVAVMGLYLGSAVVPALFIAFIVGTVVGIGIIMRVGMSQGRKTAVPFGPFLALGGVVGDEGRGVDVEVGAGRQQRMGVGAAAGLDRGVVAHRSCGRHLRLPRDGVRTCSRTHAHGHRRPFVLLL